MTEQSRWGTDQWLLVARGLRRGWSGFDYKYRAEGEFFGGEDFHIMKVLVVIQ